MTRLWVLLGIALAGCGASNQPRRELRDGDIVFQTSLSPQSRAIQEATHSRYSHMGMVVLRNGRPFVFEASATVQYTPFDIWVAHGKDGHFVVKRLRQPIAPEKMERARAVMHDFAGKRYDKTFGWSDSLMYCSELVWKVYDRAIGVHVGETQRLGEFDLTSPAVQAQLATRRLSPEEPVISPAAVFASPLLELVTQR